MDIRLCSQDTQIISGPWNYLLEVPNLFSVSASPTSGFLICDYRKGNPTGGLGGQCQQPRETLLFPIPALQILQTSEVLLSPEQQLGEDSLGLPTLPRT